MASDSATAAISGTFHHLRERGRVADGQRERSEHVQVLPGGYARSEVLAIELLGGRLQHCGDGLIRYQLSAVSRAAAEQNGAMSDY